MTADRLRRQIDHVAAVNETLPAGFRVLTGIEVDILADGSLDQFEELLARLDVVAGSVHSGLSDDSARMTRRMVTALANPHLDILGRCAGRMVAFRPTGVTGPATGVTGRLAAVRLRTGRPLRGAGRPVVNTWPAGKLRDRARSHRRSTRLFAGRTTPPTRRLRCGRDG